MNRYKYSLCGLLLLLCIESLCAQDKRELANGEIYRRVYILDFGLGVGFHNLLGSGNSVWHIEKNRGNTELTTSVQLITFASRSNIGCGLFYYVCHGGAKNYDGEVSEKTVFNYIAPQISLIKRKVGVVDGIIYMNMGMGYTNFKSEGSILQKEEYKMVRSGIGCNMGIAYEYAFYPSLGIRLGVNCIYARIKGFHKERNTCLKELSISPRRNFNLFVPVLELGLTYYLIHW